MSSRLFEKGRQGFLDGSLDWDTNSFKVIQLQLDGTLTDVAVKAITAITTATPMVVTSASHGFTTGDIVVIRGVVGMAEANGTFKLGTTATNTFELQNLDGTNAVGVNTYSSAGCVLDLTLATNLSDIDGARATNTSDSSALTTPTVVNGVADADDVTLTVTGAATVHAYAIYRDTGTASTSRLAYFTDGRTRVIVAKDAASTDTTLWVEPAEGTIATSQLMTFSNGRPATSSSQTSAFLRSIAVSSLANAITAGHSADVPTLNNALPLTFGGSATYTLQWDNGVNRIFKL